MFYTIKAGDDVFSAEPYENDRVAFSLIEMIRHQESSLLLLNESGSAMIARSGPGVPVWVWTADTIFPNEVDELTAELLFRFGKEQKISLLAKPDITRLLSAGWKKHFGNAGKISLEMTAYFCPSPLPAEAGQGRLEKPAQKDVPTVAAYLRGFEKDCFGRETSSEKAYEETASKSIASGHFYLWYSDGGPVAMANIASRDGLYGRINQVYTAPEHRGRGYAGALVASLCRILFQEGRVPMLYADIHNPASNRAYQKIGFRPGGRVDELTVEKEENRENET